MIRHVISRRTFCERTALLAGSSLLSPLTSTAATPSVPATAGEQLHLACNQYVWHVFYQREGKDLAANLDTALGEIAQAGMNGFEPIASSPGDVKALAPLLEKHQLELRSLYVNSTLHEPDAVTRSIDDILAIAEAAKRVGTRIVVTNPSPIRWGGAEDKNDTQLTCQADALNRLGKALRDLGLQLAYHYHDIELRQAAREFHHAMVGTDPAMVGLCLDTHWIYRGAGNSAVALFDVAQLYGHRIIELHVRQSRNHIWTETVDDGDIDYPRLTTMLAAKKLRPHVVLEQAVEAQSPHTMNALTAHRHSVTYSRRVFAAIA
jgi:inosose dehydratase